MDAPAHESTSSASDTGLHCLLLLARFHGLAADGAQLRHQFGETGRPLTQRELLRAAKHVGLKAGRVTATWAHLLDKPLPAIAVCADGHCVLLARAEADRVLLHDPQHPQPTILAKEHFEAMWTGELLLITTRAGMRPEDIGFGFSWFIPAIVKHRRLLGEVLAASFFVDALLFGWMLVYIALGKISVWPNA